MAGPLSIFFLGCSNNTEGLRQQGLFFGFWLFEGEGVKGRPHGYPPAPLIDEDIQRGYTDGGLGMIY